MKNIVLGVTGGIAAYKAAEIASLLVKKNYRVQVIMTAAAAEFITPLTMQTVSQQPVHMEMLKTTEKWSVEHISLAQGADLVLVAPATANTIGSVASGTAGNLLTATIMATRAPVIFAPAMNTMMYENPICQHWISFLKSMGYIFIEPEEGHLACGVSGKGRLPAPEKIVAFVERIFSQKKDLEGRHVLVTAGPTREPLDPVRFLSNYSSGKMGYALAQEIKNRGAQVTLISGPTRISVPEGVKEVPVETAQEMFNAVKEAFPTADIVIKAAAVADFRPRQLAAEKIKKHQGELVLELERTDDILGYLGEHKNKQILVGFAAETENLLKNAQDKLVRKNLDMIVANDLTVEGAGFEVDTNVATIILKDGNASTYDKMTKQELACVIVDEIVNLFKSSREE
ncbi:MAG: bifunctional phosphopantothenoylcysteine decarboxylase/phosphopantothenate--cysteine ligase CoaBC [Syntrophaceticus sp.]|jgi:phosphopantothenoylcysteine decarboxylase/phosphopantothenate--cysteine ligase|nr:bifunctional phosphopantothenoylcysteine decarboxylase/phosphopantothenate--cysteine ligase CoaBC [Syntrophaceticus sp.]HBG21949.1 bifunctional phosphopantothenoylcysteine decarboxylase/phosphopantothenate--cysteine ligase CoaBC [Peptococcaceae bacterium]MDD3314860.1 bifunctional phosphopantothenoylcysteine decarboxylase/phosphopantothenate--cysteine ligase CoaBC [Syntrophaceticus sp.]MDD4360102.1 bifunctional phosphopantothenoylcysteine decarboxylase/phosphopantothenate--cysteine ligase CoaB